MAHFKFRNAWSDAARIDPRFRDRAAPIVAPGAAAIAGELVDDQAGAEPQIEPPPAAESSPPPATAESWGTWHRGRRCKLTAEKLARAVTLRQQGWPWEEIAWELEVHRRTIHHALRKCELG